MSASATVKSSESRHDRRRRRQDPREVHPRDEVGVLRQFGGRCRHGRRDVDPQAHRGIHEHRVREPVRRQLREPPEDDREDHEAGERLQQRPCDAEQRLPVAHLERALREHDTEIAVSPTPRGARAAAARAAEAGSRSTRLRRRRPARPERRRARSRGVPSHARRASISGSASAPPRARRSGRPGASIRPRGGSRATGACSKGAGPAPGGRGRADRSPARWHLRARSGSRRWPAPVLLRSRAARVRAA